MTRSRITKAVIPAAGLGTRFLPATKAIPKEMLPIVDIPTIQLVIDEAVRAGITDVVVVNGRNKMSIEDHFDHAYELEHTLRARGATALAEAVEAVSTMVRIISVRQKRPLGLGHAVLSAQAGDRRRGVRGAAGRRPHRQRHQPGHRPAGQGLRADRLGRDRDHGGRARAGASVRHRRRREGRDRPPPHPPDDREAPAGHRAVALGDRRPLRAAAGGLAAARGDRAGPRRRDPADRRAARPGRVARGPLRRRRRGHAPRRRRQARIPAREPARTRSSGRSCATRCWRWSASWPS